MEICFVVYKSGSRTYVMNFVEHARCLGFPFKIYDCKKKNINKLKNGIVVVVKWLIEDDLKTLKDNGNIIIHDVQDLWKTYDRATYPVDILDAAVSTTRTVYEDLKERYPSFKAVHIYHPCDLEHQRAQQEVFKVGFIGEPKYNLTFRKQLRECFNIGIVKWDFTQHSSLYNCHLNLRPNYKEKGYFSPNSKVATAAACQTNIVAFPETNVQDLLPSDYPYLVEEDWEVVREKIEQAGSDFNCKHKPWTYGIEIMRNLLEDQLSIKTIAQKYLDFIAVEL